MKTRKKKKEFYKTYPSKNASIVINEIKRIKEGYKSLTNNLKKYFIHKEGGRDLIVFKRSFIKDSYLEEKIKENEESIKTNPGIKERSFQGIIETLNKLKEYKESELIRFELGYFEKMFPELIKTSQKV